MFRVVPFAVGKIVATVFWDPSRSRLFVCGTRLTERQISFVSFDIKIIRGRPKKRNTRPFRKSHSTTVVYRASSSNGTFSHIFRTWIAERLSSVSGIKIISKRFGSDEETKKRARRAATETTFPKRLASKTPATTTNARKRIWKIYVTFLDAKLVLT